MFPLGTVLFPSIFLPLHVFEPRYRVMVRRCVDEQLDFGVVLIERGSEVGGNDVRTSAGTIAHIVEATDLDDGRWVIGAVGLRRVRVREWLEDDPYPRADVETWDDEPDGDASALYGTVRSRLRRVLALAAELGDPAVDATVALSDDPVLGSYQASAVAPVGPADQQRLLLAPGPVARLGLLDSVLADEQSYLERRLAGG